ncbi:MAG: SsrA-binding protein SmpB [Saprospiraceae bacterium]|nr:SsrA-binding protein SmpB [Saprospiraceae bacterium]
MKDFKEIKNRKAKFEYHFLQSYEAGITLVGTEVKSIKSGLANLTDAYCIYKNGELFIKSLYIAEYPFGNVHNHETRRDRKLLLKKTELKKIERRVKEKGNSVIPYRIYLSERGMIKVEIHVAQGKKSYDKRESIRSKDQKRDLDRIKKISL